MEKCVAVYFITFSAWSTEHIDITSRLSNIVLILSQTLSGYLLDNGNNKRDLMAMHLVPLPVPVGLQTSGLY